MRFFYAVVFIAAAIPHFISLLDILLSSSLAEEVIPSATSYYSTLFHPGGVYQVLFSIWTQDNVPTAEGFQSLMAWEYLVTSLGILIWAGSLYSRIDSVRYAKIALLVMLAGPMGAAVCILWEREGTIRETVSFKPRDKKRANGKGIGKGSGMGKWNRGMKVLILE